MEQQFIKIKEQVSFKASWGVMCNPQLRDGHLTLPLGWEEELEKRNIEYSYVTIFIPNEIDEII
jgi:hypothetical protein